MREKYNQPYKSDLVLSSCLIQRSFKVNPEFVFGSFRPQHRNPLSWDREAKIWREGKEGSKWGQKGHFDEFCRRFCPGEFPFLLWPKMKMSQGALRYPTWLGRGVKKSGLSKMMAWGVLKTKAQAKPCTGVIPNSSKTKKQESQDPNNLWVGL